MRRFRDFYGFQKSNLMGLLLLPEAHTIDSHIDIKGKFLTTIIPVLSREMRAIAYKHLSTMKTS